MCQANGYSLAFFCYIPLGCSSNFRLLGAFPGRSLANEPFKSEKDGEAKRTVAAFMERGISQRGPADTWAFENVGNAVWQTK